MRTSVKVEGGEKLSEALKRFDEQATKEVQDVINATAQNIRNTAIRSIKQSPATGRTYKRGSISHTASATGNPPRTDTGRLVANINAKVGQLEAEIGAYIDYAPHLEFGTRKMGARPFLFPALEQNTKDYLKRLKDVVNRAITRARKK